MFKRKKIPWLWIVVVIGFALGFFLVFSSGKPLAPFVYTLF